MDRDEFMELVYETFADEPDNVLANGIIEAADAYAEPEKAQLSQEGTTSDLISRQQVLDAIVQCTNCGDEDTLREYVLKHSLDNGWTGGILEALDAVKDLPPAQPEPHWILCSKKMPDEHEWLGTKKFGTTISDEVYVTFENEKGERFCQHMKFQNGELSRYDQFHMDTWFKGSKPIAWMPLPEPYEERRER